MNDNAPITIIKPTMEVRWFSQSRPFDPLAVFGEELEPECRTDWYAPVDGGRTGVKLRDGRLEAKLRTELIGERSFGQIHGQLERWTKWSGIVSESHAPTAQVLDDCGWISVAKRRYMQSYEVDGPALRLTQERSENGCDFELTELQVRQQTWWTVGFEATGSEATILVNLERTVTESLLRSGIHHAHQLGRSCGYPEWLKTCSLI